jgi:predicted Fe-S protein YdhL (DUF1289 family)
VTSKSSKAAVRNPKVAKLAGGLRAAEIAAMSDETSTFKRDRNGLVRCRVCGCTEIDPCANACSWVEFDLCSTCYTAREALLEWHEQARRANWKALLRSLRPTKVAGSAR